MSIDARLEPLSANIFGFTGILEADLEEFGFYSSSFFSSNTLESVGIPRSAKLNPFKLFVASFLAVFVEYFT